MEQNATIKGKIESFFQACIAITMKEHRRGIADFNKDLPPGRDPLPENFHDEEWRIDWGKKFAKIVRGGSVHCFVDLTNGDVLKAASWAKPAKHARGNVLDEWNGTRTMGPYGAAYLK